MTTLKPLSRAVAAACMTMAANAFAQQAIATAEGAMAEVVVTATRGEKAVDKIPGAISIISQQELASQYLIADDPSQALSTYIPG